jgi:G3E family GTPase
MAWEKGHRIPTNLIVGFLGSGKTTAITKLIDQRAAGENWSILINEFGKVSIDHGLVDSELEGISVEELGGGCACCTLALVFKPLLAKFIRRTKPDRLILEPSGLSHPAKVVDILRSEGFSKAIDVRNIICLVDPKDFDDPKWQSSEVFQDQVQLADIVALNWTDQRDREQIDRCREWVESFAPAKQLIFETSFGALDPELLDRKFDTFRAPLFADAHSIPGSSTAELPILKTDPAGGKAISSDPTPGHPLRFENDGPGLDACGWIFHLDDIFNRKKLVDFLGAVPSVVRLKGIFRCDRDWWAINRAKDATSYVASTWRRDSRLEIILDGRALNWNEFERDLFDCLAT